MVVYSSNRMMYEIVDIRSGLRSLCTIKLLNEFYVNHGVIPPNSISATSYDERLFADLSNLCFDQVAHKLHSKGLAQNSRGCTDAARHNMYYFDTVL